QTGDHTTTYTLDDIYQLTHEVRTGSYAYDISYSYDAAGNRASKTQGGITDTYTVGDNNRLLSTSSKTLAYDNDGNLTSVTSGGQTTSLEWEHTDKRTLSQARRCPVRETDNPWYCFPSHLDRPGPSDVDLRARHRVRGQAGRRLGPRDR